jgi:hypothetical protein
MSRIASKVTHEHLEKLFAATSKNGGIRGLFNNAVGPLAKDLAKVSFDLENYDFDGTHTIKELGLTYILCHGCGDWEHPVYFAVYLDKNGKTLRAYIPEAGNPWNKTTNQAYGNDEDADREDLLKQIKKYKPELFKEMKKEEEINEEPIYFDAVDKCQVLFDKELMKQDIGTRITVHGVAVKPPKPVKCLIGKDAIKDDSDAVLKKHTAIILLLKPELTDRVNEIDPQKKLDWDSLILGWALGKGIPLADARKIFGE